MAGRVDHAFFYPQRPTGTGAEVGCTVGCTVEYTSVFLAVVACGTASLAGLSCRRDSHDSLHDSDSTSTFLFACTSVATLLLAMIIEQTYIFGRIGRVVCSTAQYLPSSGWRWGFWISLPFCWALFVIGETSLIIAIKGLYHHEPREMLFLVAAMSDGFIIMIFTICLHPIVGEIYFRISLQDQIDALPDVYESAAEVCVICIGSLSDEDVTQELSCHHSFHKSWLSTKPLCPICRRDV